VDEGGDPAPVTVADDGDRDARPQLDRWGLPPPTADDIFPPRPPGTELVAATPDRRYSLAEIGAALRDHIVLDGLGRHFDDGGVERRPAAAAGDAPKMRLILLHESPPVLAIENFLTPAECFEVERVAMPPPSDDEDADAFSTNNLDVVDSPLGLPVMVESKTFDGAISERTSTSWFCHYGHVPALLAKARHCLGISLEQMEEPQIVRYRTGQQFR